MAGNSRSCMNFVNQKGIHISAYSPLGRVKEGGVLSQPVIKMVAEKLGKSLALVVLAWSLLMGYSVLPKSSIEARMKENMDIFDWSIPEDLLCKFSEIKQEKLIKAADSVHEESAGYKAVDELWDGKTRVNHPVLAFWHYDLLE